MEDLAQKMIEYRAKESISQEELAERCNLSLKTISRVELGKSKCSKITLAKIKRIVEV